MYYSSNKMFISLLRRRAPSQHKAASPLACGLLLVWLLPHLSSTISPPFSSFSTLSPFPPPFLPPPFLSSPIPPPFLPFSSFSTLSPLGVETHCCVVFLSDPTLLPSHQAFRFLSSSPCEYRFRMWVDSRWLLPFWQRAMSLGYLPTRVGWVANSAPLGRVPVSSERGWLRPSWQGARLFRADLAPPTFGRVPLAWCQGNSFF